MLLTITVESDTVTFFRLFLNVLIHPLLQAPLLVVDTPFSMQRACSAFHNVNRGLMGVVSCSRTVLAFFVAQEQHLLPFTKENLQAVLGA